MENVESRIALKTEQLELFGPTPTGGVSVRFDRSKVHTAFPPEEQEQLALQGEDALVSLPIKKDGIRSFPDLPDEIRAVMKKRLAYVEALSAEKYLRRTKKDIDRVIEAVAKEIEDKNPPTWNTAYRWLRLYEQSNKDVFVLHPEYKKRGRKGLFITEAHDLSTTGTLYRITKVIVEKHYLKPERPSVAEVYELLKDQIENQNSLGVEDQALRIPHINTLRHFITKHFDPYLVDKARYGKLYADHKWTARGIGPRPERPLERVEIDHSPLDIIVIDDESYLPLGRLTNTSAIDGETKSIIGVQASFATESWLSVRNCLIHAMRPKTGVKEKFGLKNEWPCHGLMETLVLDRGLGGRNLSLYDSCLQLGIKVIYAPPRTPQFKGTIERFFRRQNDSLIHSKPGTTFSNVLAKGNYDPVKNAVIRLSDFNRILHTWIVDIYHQEIHQGIEGIPAKLWAEKTKLYPVVDAPDLSLLQVLLGQIAVRKPSPRKGIELYGLRYNCPELSLALRKLANRGEAKLKFDPSDISIVYFEDKSENCFIPIPCTDQKYARGLSLWQHRLIKRYLREELLRSVDQAGLREARMRIQQIVEQAVFDRKRLNKSVARYLGKGLDTNYQDDASSIAATKLSSRPITSGTNLPATSNEPLDGIAQAGEGPDAAVVGVIEDTTASSDHTNQPVKSGETPPIVEKSQSSASPSSDVTSVEEDDLPSWTTTSSIRVGK